MPDLPTLLQARVSPLGSGWLHFHIFMMGKISMAMGFRNVKILAQWMCHGSSSLPVPEAQLNHHFVNTLVSQGKAGHEWRSWHVSNVSSLMLGDWLLRCWTQMVWTGLGEKCSAKMALTINVSPSAPANPGHLEQQQSRDRREVIQIKQKTPSSLHSLACVWVQVTQTQAKALPSNTMAHSLQKGVWLRQITQSWGWGVCVLQWVEWWSHQKDMSTSSSLGPGSVTSFGNRGLCRCN